MTEEEPETARRRILQALKEAGEDGLSKSELSRIADINRGAFRKLVVGLVTTETVTVTYEHRSNGGKTAVHRLPEFTAVAAA